MNVFMTGGTGYLGSAIVRALHAGGHRVTSLARSDASREALAAAGVAAVRGDLGEPGSYAAEMARSDAVIHAAQEYGPRSADIDALAVEQMLAAARDGAPVVCIYTSGSYVLGEAAAPADERSSTEQPAAIVAWRVPHERRVLEATTDEVATAVIRPGTVWGGTGGTIGRFFATAERDGAVQIVGDGANHWSTAHRDDAAMLYRLVIEERARGIFHAVDGEPTPVIEIARAAGEAAGHGGAVRTIPLDEARKKLGSYADALVLDGRVYGRRSTELGWVPVRERWPAAAATAFAEWKAGRRS
jgi:nucleoside-diphosphate-sugar epimerase